MVDNNYMPRSNSNQVVVVFGGSGFIGSRLISDLLINGFTVHVADINHCDNPNVIFHSCDVRSEIQLELETTPDFVINLAAVHRTPGHETGEYYETNVAGALRISSWCDSMGVAKLLFTSSIAVYGPGADLKDESSLLKPVHAYGKSKILAEQIFENWQKIDEEKRTLIICRPAVIFGSGERGNYARMAKAIRRGLFFIPGDANLIKSSGYVGDLSRSILFTMDKVVGFQIYNFCFPTELSIKEITSTMATIGGWKRPKSLPLRPLVPLLKHLGYPLSHLGKRIEKLLLPTRISPKVLTDMKFNWQYDLNLSLSEWFDQSQFDIHLKE